MNETVQTQDPDPGASLDEMTQASGADELGISGDDATADLGISGLDTLPEHDQRNVRNSILQKHNELAELRREAQEERQRYLQAISALQQSQRPLPDSPATQIPPEQEFAGLNGYQIMERIADRRAEQRFNELMERSGFPQVKQNSDAVMRELQIIQARTVFPDLMRYEKSLVELGQQLERDHGPERAAKISILDMMGMLKAREAQRAHSLRQNGQGPRPPQAQRTPQPQGAVSRPGQGAQRVAEIKRPSNMAEAFQLAKKELGITGDFRHSETA